MYGPMMVIGRVRSVAPGHRQVRVMPAAGSMRHYAGLEWVTVALREPVEGLPDAVRCRVAGVTAEPRQVTVTFTAGVARDTVARMKGAELQVESSAIRGNAEDDPAQWTEYAVQDEAGNDLGRVASVEHTGAQHVLTIASGGRTILAPAVDAVVAAVDVERGVVVVRDLAPFAVEYEPVVPRDKARKGGSR